MFSPAYFFYLPSAVILYSPTASGAEQVSKTNHLIETLLLEEFPVVGSEPVGYDRDKRGRRYELGTTVVEIQIVVRAALEHGA